jgi:uncharacterized protein with FMN-binding domain
MKAMRRGMAALLAAVVLVGCQQEDEGQVLQFPTEQQAREMEEAKRADPEFKPGVYSGVGDYAAGDVSLRAEFRGDKEAVVTRIVSGATPKSETMRGSYTLESGVIEVKVTEINSENRQVSLYFFVEDTGLSYQDVEGGNTVRILLSPLGEDEPTNPAPTQPPANKPATPPRNAPGATVPSNAPSAPPTEPTVPLAEGQNRPPRNAPEGPGPFMGGV